MAIKVRSLEELVDCLNNDMAWRKKEIADMRSVIEMSGHPDYLVRAGFVMLCAHFEGFIRYAANAYVALVSAQRVKISQLKSCFSAIKLRDRKHDLFLSNGEKVKTSTVSQLIDEYHALLDQEFVLKVSDDNIPFVDEENPAIHTDSNPSSAVLGEISNILGLDYESLFSPRAPFIDGELLKPRHRIAHGGRIPIRSEQYFEVHDYVLIILEEYAEAILNEATLESYRAS